MPLCIFICPETEGHMLNNMFYNNYYNYIVRDIYDCK